MIQKIIIISLIVGTFFGCASAPKKNTASSASSNSSAVLGPVQVENENYGPPVPAEELEKKPERDEEAQKKIEERKANAYVVYFTPAFARSLAYVGVLKILEDNEIKIDAVAGTELGALVSAIWAKGGANKLEWEIFKFNKEILFEKRFLLGYEKTSNAEEYEKFLESTFDGSSVENFKKKVWISISEMKPGRSKLVQTGRAVDVLRQAIGVPGLVNPKPASDGKKYIATLDEPLPIEKIKELSQNKILCVDALGDDFSYDSSDSREETIKTLYYSVAARVQKNLEKCDEKILIDTKKFGFLQFDPKADIIFSGKQAALKWLESKAE